MVPDRFLVPANAGQERVTDADADDDLFETAEPPGATDDDTPREGTAVRERRLPSSMGLSVLLPGEAQRLSVRITWGDYRLEAESSGPEIWKRIARDENRSLDVSLPVNQPVETEMPGWRDYSSRCSRGLWARLTPNLVCRRAQRRSPCFSLTNGVSSRTVDSMSRT